ncbi:hypothetical protein GCM10008927_28060 [Amylibacter ulvae]|uniref:Uncharacterized protein n=2 Tax=Paramylibacter ulvae TaxID=1651968 RepID=A0ABQ3D674_9RHOB|nr:hypothetical protein GCM10008927_28060 [Amylibacter ulvae]
MATYYSDFVAKHGTVSVLTTHVSAGPPLALAADVTWGIRHSSQWLVPGVVNGLLNSDCEVQSEYCERLRKIGEIARDDVVLDIQQFTPSVIVVDKRSGYINTPDFNWISFMEQDNRFSLIMDSYVLEKSTGRFDFYLRLSDENSAPH